MSDEITKDPNRTSAIVEIVEHIDSLHELLHDLCCDTIAKEQEQFGVEPPVVEGAVPQSSGMLISIHHQLDSMMDKTKTVMNYVNKI